MRELNSRTRPALLSAWTRSKKGHALALFALSPNWANRSGRRPVRGAWRHDQGDPAALARSAL